MSRRKKAPKKSHIGAVLDRSGSMSSMAHETRMAFDAMIKKVREEAGTPTFVTLVQFDTDKETVYEQKPIADVPPLKLVPRGLTALLDGVGEAIRRMEKFVKPGDNVVIHIMTDGGENSSSEYSKEAIIALMDEKREDGWEFNYLGAGPNSWAGAGMLGIANTHVINYAGDAVQQDMAFQAMASSSVAKTRGLTASYSASAPALKAQLEHDVPGVQPPFGKPQARRRGSGKNLK